MAHLTGVSIRRFKQLKQVNLDLSDITLLIGSNNSGKSSFLQAIHFAISIAQSSRLVGRGVAWRQDKFQVSFNPTQLIYSPNADVMSLATGGTLQEANANEPIEIELRTADPTTCLVALSRGRNRNIAVSIEGRALGERLMDLENPFTVYAPGLAGVAREERYLSPGVVRRIVARGDANLVLRNVLHMLKSNAATWEAFLADMRSVFDGLQIYVSFNESTDETISVDVRLRGGPRLPIEAAGTSVLQVSQILGYVALFKPQLLILDEPDSHLHPDRQRILCDLICRLAQERNFQAVISTHSRHVLDSLKSRSGVAWLSKGTLVAPADINTTAILLDLGALDSADYFADGALRCVVVSEDTDTTALQALLMSNGFVAADTEVRSYASCTKVDSAIVLGAFLRDKAPAVKLVIHRDRDYMDDHRVITFEGMLNAANVRSFVTTPNDIEGYFLNAGHLHALNPAVPQPRIDELLTQATAETADDSIAAIVNQRVQYAFDIQRRGGAAPNHGAIAIAAQTDYHADPVAYRRGKIVLKRAVALLRGELAAAPRVFAPSGHLVDPRLRELARLVWGNA